MANSADSNVPYISSQHQNF